jgi:hypothetical protein
VAACRAFAVSLVLLPAAAAAGQPGPRLDVPVVDEPYGASLGRWPSVELEAKSDGWVAGNAWLDACSPRAWASF